MNNRTMVRKNLANTLKGISILIPITFFFFLIAFTACDKDNEPAFNPDFSFNHISDNYVEFINESTGEYYSLTWDFGNGQEETTTDKTQSFIILYPTAGDFEVSLSALNYSGTVKTATKTISITNTLFAVDFTAEISISNPNYVTLTNTTIGDYDSFKWLYLNKVVEDQMQEIAYFRLAGSYDIELVVTKDGTDHTVNKTVTILQDDPNYVQGMELVWFDEFDYTGQPESSKWNIETGGFGGGNGELQYYTNSQDNLKVENGVLTITARKEQIGGKDYSSARITTQNKFDFKYGKIEARIKMPYSQGMWPAFWMLGSNLSTVGWPECGEIDIVEMVGGPGKDNTAVATLHWDNNGSNAAYGESYTIPSGILADDYHIFSVEWDEQKIKAFIAGTQYFVIDITDPGLSEFHNNFFIILNLAVGGDWPGSPDGTTVFPQTMEVDYVRVYQKDDSSKK
ncbi:MAG: family 16 glycosylhydrolase [Bacteroidales bacterium]|nr:family 16 glycosylhydrolase [Bacteroidales bacterium]MCF8454357.1 family 16 glycosylhydrolase [Bacteroidales bacterium]